MRSLLGSTRTCWRIMTIGKYTGSDVKVDGQDHIILSEDDVLGVLEG